MSTKNTVKVKITLELEVPDKNYAEQGMKQLLFDNLINFAAIQCSQMATKWSALEEQELANHYTDWGRIIHESHKTMKVEF